MDITMTSDETLAATLRPCSGCPEYNRMGKIADKRPNVELCNEFNMNQPQKIRIIVSNFYKSINTWFIEYLKIVFPKIKSFSFKKFYSTLTGKIVIAILAIYLLSGIGFSLYLYKKRPAYTYFTKIIVNVYPIPATIAHGKFISLKTVYVHSEYVLKYSAQTGQKVDGANSVRNNIINQLVELRYVNKELKKSRLYINDNEVNKVYDDKIRENGGEEEIKKVLESLYGMSLPEFKTLVKSLLQKDLFRNNVLENIYAYHILVGEEAKAKEIIADINENKISFEDAAKQFSKDVNTRDSGGDLGFFARGVRPQPFDDIAFAKAEINKVYPDPIKTDFGWHIIKVTEKRGRIAKSYDQWLDETKKSSRIIRLLK